jgi:hypothetical protein
MIAGLVLALLLGLLLLRGMGSKGPTGPVPRSPPSSSARDPGDLPTSPAPASPVPAPDPPGNGRTPFVLEGVARFEDGTPIPGIRFLEMERSGGGEPEVVLDASAIDRVASGMDGTFALRWDRRPAEILLLVLCDEAEVAAAGNGALLGAGRHGETVRADPDAGPLGLAMRWRAGHGFLRLRDGRTGEVLLRGGSRALQGGVVVEGPPVLLRWVRTDGAKGDPGGDSREGRGTDAEGWIRIPAPPAEAREPGATAAYALEIVADGYARTELPLDRIRGRVEATLAPAVADVTGILAIATDTSPGFPVGWHVLPEAEGQPQPSGVRADLRGPGPFALFDLPDGKWTLEIWASTAEGTRFARRAFEKAGGPVDLGVLEASRPAGFRVRVLDAEGNAFPAGVVASRTKGPSSGHVVEFLNVDGAQVLIDSGGRVVAKLGEGGEALRPDPDGWQEIPGVVPGVRYRLSPQVPGVPPREETAPEAGEFATVEIRTRLRPVRCSVRFAPKGGTVAEWRVAAIPLVRRAWRDGGFLEGTLYPGDYEIHLMVHGEGGKKFRGEWVRFTVPDQPSWTATIEF